MQETSRGLKSFNRVHNHVKTVMVGKLAGVYDEKTQTANRYVKTVWVNS